jgi:adenylate kinase
MIVALTGTPGTGKTAVSKLLLGRLNAKIKSSKDRYKLIVLNKVAEKNKSYVGFDELRQSKVVNMKKLKADVKKEIGTKKNVLMEGHFSHLLLADIVIILRTHPAVLEKRLRKKYKWPTKIDENVEAEMMSVILDETLPNHKPGTVFEIDTTKLQARSAAAIAERIIVGDEKEKRERLAGRLDWLRGM